MVVSKYFNSDEYYDYISNFDKNQILAELNKIQAEIDHELEEQRIHQRLIDNHYDDPAYEHLIEMSIADNNGRDDLINIDKRKISILNKILEER